MCLWLVDFIVLVCCLGLFLGFVWVFVFRVLMLCFDLLFYLLSLFVCL